MGVHVRSMGGPWEVHGKSTGARGPWLVHGRSTGSTRSPWEVHGRFMGGPWGLVH